MSKLAASAGRWGRFLPCLAGVVAAGMAARNLIGGYGDLGIYLDAAREFCAGGIDLFRAREHSGPWAYPHFAVLPFAALQALLGDAATRWLYCGLMGLATAAILGDVVRLTRPTGGLRPWQWLVFGVLFQRCLAQNLSHGQLSLFVAAFVTRGVLQLQNGRDVAAGAWLGLAAALKLTPALFLLALLPMRKGRAAVAMAASLLTLLLLVPWPFCGTAEHLRHLEGAFLVFTGSLAEPGAARIVDWYAGPSIRGTLDYLLQPRPLDEQGTTTNIVDLGDRSLLLVKAVWSTLIAAVLVAWFARARRLPEPARLAHQAAAVMLAMSFFSPLLRVYHLSAAMLPFALYCQGPRRRDFLWWATAVSILFAMTLRQRKLIGDTLWRAFDVGGLLHFALVALLCWLCIDAVRSTARA